MRSAWRIAGLAGCLFAIPTIGAAQDQSAGISGTVVDSATHQAVKNASVSLDFITGPASNQGHHAATTDASGAFSFGGLAEGRYGLTATHQNYPQGSRQAHKTVEIKSGGRASSITLELIPGAVIAGHVVDEDGDPMSGCFVEAAPASNPTPPYAHFAGSNTNEEGEYRIHGLTSGTYVVSARCGTVAFTPRPFSSGPDPPPTAAYPIQYYPLAPDVKSAQAVDLAPAAEKPGIDFRIRPAPVTQVRGSIRSDSPAEGLNIQLIPVSGAAWAMGPRMDTGKGTFEFAQVFPGTYYVEAINNGDPTTRLTGVERIEVKDRPVEMVLTLSHGVDITGSVSVEGAQPNTTIPLTQLRVQLESDVPLPMLGGEQTQVKEDGTFVLKSVPLGRWKLMVFGPQVYLKSAWLGTTDVTHTVFDVSAGTEALRIVVSANMGGISGTAPAGEMVYAATDVQGGGRLVLVDQTGHFTLPQIPPGKYRVGAVDPGLPIPEEGGQEVTVKEGETVTVEIKQP
jgi:hypothetical protein